MELFNFSEGKFKALIKKGLTLDTLYVLEKIRQHVDIQESFKEARITSLLQTLERKGYYSEGNITDAGEELYQSLITEEEEVKVKKLESKESEWEEFLSYYPPNNRFIWRGRSFDGDRGIKNNTKKGKEYFTQIVNNGISCKSLWKAVVAEAIAKMEKSYKSGENQMKYFINTESYLYQKRYMNFIEEGKELTEADISAYKEAYNRKKKVNVQKKSIDI